MLRVGSGRVAAVIATVAAMVAAGATAALAQTGPPGQWSMAGQNINDTHYQAAEHEISPANAGRWRRGGR
jgi:polyvinyl alcohol dehydrogenase (cytochrome)